MIFIMKILTTSYFNPVSNKHHALKNFEYLTSKQKFRAIALTTLAALPTFGVFAIPVFRLLTKSTVPTQELAKRCHQLRPIQNLSLSDISNDLTQIKKFLKDGGSINQQDKVGFTLLHHAVVRNRVDIMKFLIKNGASLNIQDKTGNSPLFNAVYNGNLGICKLLLEQGASVNLQESKGYSPAHSAAEKGRIDILNLLIEKGADVELVNKKGYSVLAQAKISNPQNYKEVKQIITRQSNISKFSKRESYARHLLGHSYSLRGHSQLLPKKGSKIIPLSLEGSSGTGGRFWQEILRDYQLLIDEHPFNQDSKDIFLDALRHAKGENSSEDLFKRWSEGKPIIVHTGYTGHAVTMLIIKDRIFMIDGTLSCIGNNTVTRRMPAITEPIIKAMLDLKKEDEKTYSPLMKQLIAGFEEESEQDRQIQNSFSSYGIGSQASGNCSWASKWGAAYILYQTLGGKLSFSDVSALTMCSQANKYLDKLNDPQNPYLPSPFFISLLTFRLKFHGYNQCNPVVKAKADETISRLTEAWNALFQYPTADLAEEVKKEWLDELENSKPFINRDPPKLPC